MRGGGAGTRWRRALAILLCLHLVAACGARWSTEEREAVFARGAGGEAAVASSEDDGGVGPGVVLTGGDGSPVSGPADAPDGTTGTGGAGSSGSAGPPAAGGSLPCAAHSDAPGVTDDVITVGNLATVSGPIPGLATTAQAAARSYVAYRNSVGGACGRQIRLLTADDAGEGSRTRAQVTDLSRSALGIIGWFSPAGAAAADLIEEHHLPVIGSVGSPEVRRVSTVFNTNPPPADRNATIAKFRYLYAQGVRTAAVVTLSAAAAVEELDQHQAQIEAAGIRVVSRQILPVTTLSFDSAARVVANSHADYLFFLAAAQHDAAMARSMRDSGYTPKYEEYLTGYGSNYPELAGSAAEGTSSWLRSVPTEEAAGNPELRTFLEWMHRTTPGVPTDVFAVDAWSASKAFFDALEQLPGPIGRDALVARLRTFTRYEAGGLIGPIDLANGKSNGCLVGVRYQSGEWRRMAPAQGFLC